MALLGTYGALNSVTYDRFCLSVTLVRTSLKYIECSLFDK